MKNDTSSILFAILRSVFHGNELSSAEKAMLSEVNLPELMVVAKGHDIAHLIALGLQNNHLISNNPKFQKDIFTAVYRYEQLNYELNRASAVLEKEKIPFIPLKGSVICKYYPNPWMRTSCDVDILVQKDDFEKAVSCLKKELNYDFYFETEHDMSLTSSNGVHIELHFDLVEEWRAKLSNKILLSIWDNVTHKEGYSYWYEMSDEMFYFYHIAHMAKHFETGGCGIRPFIDLWILDNMENVNENKRDALLEQGELLKFTKAARALSKVWMEDKPHDSVTEKMQEFIILGGNYGSSENRVAVSQYKKGSKLKYALSRIFIPYKELKCEYPILEKHRWLTPVMQVRRLCRLIFGGNLKRVTRQLSDNKNISKIHSDDMRQLMTEIGL